MEILIHLVYPKPLQMTVIENQITVVASNDVASEQPGHEIQDADIVLRVNRHFVYSDKEIPGIEFTVLSEDENAGTCTALLESDFTKIKDVGNVGMELIPAFRGKGICGRSIRMLYPLFKSYGQEKLLFTCPEDHHSIIRVCEKLGSVRTEDAGDGKVRFTIST
jgi:hypothetical protein